MVPSSPAASPTTTVSRTDIGERVSSFAKNIRGFVRKTPRDLSSLGDCRELLKVSGNLGFNYIAADTAENAQRFTWRMQDCRREARQSAYYLELLDANLEEASERTRKDLAKEAKELDRIFTAIVIKMIKKAKTTQPAEAAAEQQ